jgi:CBS-domain-containing membrane protein
MRILRHVFDRRSVPHWRSYVQQSVFAAASVSAVLVALHERHLAVTASLAATAFTLFVMPNSVTSSPRNVVGGHAVGLAFGSLFALIPQSSASLENICPAMAVGAAMFVMAITNTEHPPAAGTALALVITGFSWRLVVGVAVGVVVLSLIHRWLRPSLRDLIAAPEQSGRNRDGE